jgi:hypothetical protein
MGISVQCRSRAPGTENTSVNLHGLKRLASRASLLVVCLTQQSLFIVPAPLFAICCLSITWRRLQAGSHDDPKIALFELTGCANWRDGSKVLETVAGAP